MKHSRPNLSPGRSVSGRSGILKVGVLFVLLSLCGVLSAAESYSQTKLSLDMKSASIKDVFREIERTSEFIIFYGSDTIDDTRRVDITATGATVSEILDRVLDPATTGYTVHDRQVVVFSRSADTQAGPQPQQPQILTVTGRITNSAGEGLLGAGIVLEGSPNVASIVANNGTYSIRVPADGTLRVIMFGYEDALVPVNGRTSIDVVMESEVNIIDDVVVVGFGTQLKENLTGAVSTLSSDELESRPVTYITQALQGLAPGLNVKTGTGSFESTPSINIRGTATIGDGSNGDPLVLIDGMEGDINSLNPNDVANISVLKDAAASSIYGSRAPFGVILITTKTGRDSDMQINYSANARRSDPIILPKVMDSYTFASYFNEASRNAGVGEFFNPERMQRIIDFQQGKLGNMTVIPNPNNPVFWGDGYEFGNDNVDLFRAIFKAASWSQEHNLSVTGGSDKVNFYLSGNFLDQNGLLKIGEDKFRRYAGTAKLNAKLSKWADLSFSLRYTRTDYTRPQTYNDNIFQDVARQAWPTMPLRDPNGYYYDSPSPALGLSEGGIQKTQNDEKYYQIQLNIHPLEGWNIIANFNYRVRDNFYHRDRQMLFNHDVAGNPYVFNNTSEVREEARRMNFFSPSVHTDYSFSLGNHNMKVMAGFQVEENKERYMMASRRGIIVPGSPQIDITSGTDYNGNPVTPGVGGNITDWATVGVFGRVNYDYDGRYLLEVNMRYDGTSRFRADNRWKLFPSASVGWNVAREKFWEPLARHINQFKIRGSYGTLGNQNTRALYPTYQTMNYGTSNGSWLVGGMRPNTSSAPGLISAAMTWETVRTWNVGVDLGMFRNRLNASFDLYTRYTNNMIGPAPELPVILGTNVPRTNNTDLKTSGFELSLQWRDRLKGGFGYSARVTLSDDQTTVTRYPNPTERLNTHRTGGKMNEIWGYTTIGIAKTHDEMNAHLASLPNGGQNALGSNWMAGDIMYKDLNGDGKIDSGAGTLGDHGDHTVIGNSTPRYKFGIDLSADWKGFDMRAFFQGIGKRDFFHSTYYFWGVGPDWDQWRSTGFVNHMDYFRDEPNGPMDINLDSYYPRPIFNTRKNQQVQTRYLQDASYIRLKNFQLGYTLPTKITQHAGIDKLRIYLSGENLFTISRMSKIFDPETVDVEWGRYPLSRVFSMGINVTF